MHEAVFASAGPVSCPFAALSIALVAEAIPMRGSKKGLAGPSQVVAPFVQCGAPSPGNMCAGMLG
eukprot:11176826-Lingulodinium_polyedra.AAC.1